jgi:hypothetical protein
MGELDIIPTVPITLPERSEYGGEGILLRLARSIDREKYFKALNNSYDIIADGVRKRHPALNEAEVAAMTTDIYMGNKKLSNFIETYSMASLRLSVEDLSDISESWGFSLCL